MAKGAGVLQMNITVIDIGLLIIGAYIIIEGIISLGWEFNDKSWLAQTGRIVRTFSGVAVVLLVLFGSYFRG